MIFEAGKVGVNMVSEIQLYSLICIIYKRNEFIDYM